MLTCGYDEAVEVTPTHSRTMLARHGVDSLAASFNGTAARRVKAREHVFCEGDPAKHVYRIESGLICTYRIMHDGRRQVVDFAFPGDVVGLGASSEHNTSAQAVRPTRLRCLSASALSDAMRNDPRLMTKLYQTLAEELRAARELLLSVCQRSASERLAAFLMALVRRNERRELDAGTLDLGMTRTDIADFLGLTIETVSRTFTKFRKSGLIDIAQCTAITIVDRQGLEELAAGNRLQGD